MQVLSLKIMSREKVILEKEVYAVSSYNQQGIFDVLPEHAHFISLITDKVIVHHTQSEKEELPLKTGIMNVFDNTVIIYTDVLSPFTHPA